MCYLTYGTKDVLERECKNLDQKIKVSLAHLFSHLCGKTVHVQGSSCVRQFMCKTVHAQDRSCARQFMCKTVHV